MTTCTSRGRASFGAYFKQLVEKKELLPVAPHISWRTKSARSCTPPTASQRSRSRSTPLLTDLADKLPDMAERAYYKEALICYNHGSPRGAVVMTWNIAYSHVCDYVLTKRLADFNARWQVSYPGMHKNKVRAIASMDDFTDELKESEVLTYLPRRSIITKNVYNILHAALGKRNAAAHPSSVVIDQFQTDAYIVDLITNVVQKIV